jgi:hypothetical protein
MLIVIALLAAAPSPPAAATPNQTDPVVCRRQDSEVGTHMRPKPICMKKSDWDIVEAKSQRELDNLRDKHLDPGYASPPR